MEYRRDIDGLRAVAVLPVILFHAGLPGFSGGYVGVDIFFVISGYLITSIIITDLEKEKFSIAKFYERRARRILPALFFVLIACIPFAWAWLPPKELKNFAQAITAISLFSSNVLFWLKEGYFESTANLNPLLHTWSLAVEEQFYIFFPILLLSLRRFGKRTLLMIIIFLCLLSFSSAEIGWRLYPSANFYLLPSRAWELGVGAVCAFILLRPAPTTKLPLSFIGLLAIVFSIVAFDENTPFPSIYTTIPVLGTALIIVFRNKNSLTNKILSTKLFVGMGLVSFSAYLWHQPIFSFSRIRSETELDIQVMLLLSLISFALAAFSWRYVEQPFRVKKYNFSHSPNQVLGASALLILISISVGFYGHVNHGFPDRTAPSGKTFSDLNISTLTKANYGLDRLCNGSSTFSPECKTGDLPTIAIWGDSFAMHLAQSIKNSPSMAGNRNFVQLTKSACTPSIGFAKISKGITINDAKECIKFNDQVLEWITENKHIEYLIISSAMNIIHNEIIDRDGSVLDDTHYYIQKSFNETAEILLKNGIKSIIISPPPMTGSDLSKCALHNLTFNSDKNMQPCSFKLDETSDDYKKIMSFLEGLKSKFPLVDLAKLICVDDVCSTIFENENLYRDNGHLSVNGSIELGKAHDLWSISKLVSDSFRY